MDRIAIVGWPTLDLDQQDLVAEVERVDISPRTIYLRENDGRSRVVAYSETLPSIVAVPGHSVPVLGRTQRAGRWPSNLGKLSLSTKRQRFETIARIATFQQLF